LISAGGTGGGVYPALAIAEALHQRAPDRLLHYVGSVGMERDLIQRSGSATLFASFDQVQSGPLNGVSPLRRIQSAFKIGLGVLQALQIVQRHRPAALLITGGWPTFPIALACRILRVPIALFVPDIEPGLTLKVLGRLASAIYATTTATQPYFPARSVTATGYPLRSQILSATRADAITHFSLDPARRTLLIFGGSRGARSINQALGVILPDLLADGLQIIHIAGQTDWPTVSARRDLLSAADRERYHAYPYLHDEMGLALAAADLALSRAGASALGEFPAFGLPAILIPYPFAWRYQKINADWLADRGAALRLADEALDARLLPTILELFHDPDRLTAMHRASLALAIPDGADRVAQALLALADHR